MAQCSCDGNIGKYALIKLKRSHTTSCGCLKAERTIESHTLRMRDYEERYPLFCKVEEIMDNPDGYGIIVRCKHADCKKWFKPTRMQLRNRIVAIENQMGLTENNLYCSNECKNSCPLFNVKSDPFKQKEINNNVSTGHELSIWSDEVLKQQHEQYGYNFCIKCKSINDLSAHHIDPKKLEPFFALDPENGFVTCAECHGEFHKGECSTGALAYKVCKKIKHNNGEYDE